MDISCDSSESEKRNEIYVGGNIEARSHNYFWPRKAMNYVLNLLSMCLWFALVIRFAKRIFAAPYYIVKNLLCNFCLENLPFWEEFSEIIHTYTKVFR